MLDELPRAVVRSSRRRSSAVVLYGIGTLLLPVAKVGASLSNPAEISTFDFDTESKGVKLARDDANEVNRTEHIVDTFKFGEQLCVMVVLVPQELGRDAVPREVGEVKLCERFVVDAV